MKSDADAKNSDSDKRASVTRKMVRSATFEGLPRNVELPAAKSKGDSQLKPSNQAERSKKVAHKSRHLSDKKDELVNKAKTQVPYDKLSENVHNSRDDPCTSVINRHDHAKSTKTDQSSVRVTKV